MCSVSMISSPFVEYLKLSIDGRKSECILKGHQQWHKISIEHYHPGWELLVLCVPKTN